MRQRVNWTCMHARLVRATFLLAAAHLAAQTLPLEGIAHIGFRAASLAASRAFYTGQLGFAQAFDEKNSAGETALAFFKINDSQYIELSQGIPAGNPERFTHLAFETGDLAQLRTLLAARGLTPPEPVKGRDGNLAFSVQDPTGQRIEFVQYMPGSLHWNARGKFLDARRISTHLQHVGVAIPASQLDSALHFYRDQLGFSEFWRFSPNGQLRLIKLLVPGARRDIVELMLYDAPPTGAQYGSMQHVNFEVPDITPPCRTLLGRGAGVIRPLRPVVNAENLWAMNLLDPDGTRIEIQDLKKVPVTRIAIAGLVHGHVAGFLPHLAGRYDAQLVGVAEPDAALARRYAARYRLDSSLFYPSLEAMLDKVKPQAVVVYTNTYDHLKVVEACAARGIDVMMEKPLSASLEQAHAMQAAAKRGHIHVLVNYETTWYASNAAAWADASATSSLGPIRKMVAHDGHRGPREIGVPPEFLDWLTDPARNGAGALFDFGCYGADLMTWLMNGERPVSVTAVLGHAKPAIYSKVDDEATVILAYPHAQGIIQASWNWPFDIKDLEVYGATGSIHTIRADRIRRHLAGHDEEEIEAPPLDPRQADSLSYLTAVVRGEIPPAGLSSLDLNVTVMEILDAARASAASGRTVTLPAL